MGALQTFLAFAVLTSSGCCILDWPEPRRDPPQLPSEAPGPPSESPTAPCTSLERFRVQTLDMEASAKVADLVPACIERMREVGLNRRGLWTGVLSTGEPWDHGAERLRIGKGPHAVHVCILFGVDTKIRTYRVAQGPTAPACPAPAPVREIVTAPDDASGFVQTVTEDGEPLELPTDIAEGFRGSRTPHLLWEGRVLVWITDRTINAYAFDEGKSATADIGWVDDVVDYRWADHQRVLVAKRNRGDVTLTTWYVGSNGALPMPATVGLDPPPLITCGSGCTLEEARLSGKSFVYLVSGGPNDPANPDSKKVWATGHAL